MWAVSRLFATPSDGESQARYKDRATRFFHALAQRYGFRTNLAGLLMPRDRSKTLTALVGAEPLVTLFAGFAN
jgi:hypothetical protein